jgi:hypothetical protein
MLHAQKQHWMGCAIATAAMIGDVTYEEVEFLAGGRSPATLRRPWETRRLLQKVTKSKWRSRWLWRRRPLTDWSFPEWPVAVFLQDGAWRSRYGQWVGVKGELVHDPEFCSAARIDRYCRRDWFIHRWLEPVQPTARKTRARADFVLTTLTAELANSPFVGELSSNEYAARK